MPSKQYLAIQEARTAVSAGDSIKEVRRIGSILTRSNVPKGAIANALVLAFKHAKEDGDFNTPDDNSQQITNLKNHNEYLQERLKEELNRVTALKRRCDRMNDVAIAALKGGSASMDATMHILDERGALS